MAGDLLLKTIVRPLIVSLAVLLYYGLGTRHFAGASRAIASRLPMGERYSFTEVANFTRLTIAGVSQLAFCLVLLVIGGLQFQQLGLNHIRPLSVVYGAALGLGEMGLGSFLGYLSMRIAISLIPAKVPTELNDWLAVAKGGWMRELLQTVEITPLPVAFFLIILYVGVEETIFRAVIINVLLPAGVFWALVGSVLLFAIVQTFHMPSSSAAMFPVIAAFLVGTVHGLLFLSVPDLLPLIIAHFVFFVAGLL